VEQADLLRYAIRSLESLKVAYMLVGSFASIAYGEPRFTQDIDIVLDLPETSVADFCSAFPPPEFYLNQDSIVDAIRKKFQFNLLHPGSGSKIDFLAVRTDWVSLSPPLPFSPSPLLPFSLLLPLRFA
jgi:hypothetical protein